MRYYDAALETLRSAQERIKDLLAEAVETQAYPEVARLAALAERLVIALNTDKGVVLNGDAKPLAEGDGDVVQPKAPVLHERVPTRAGRLPGTRRRPKKSAKAPATRKAAHDPKPLPEGYPRFEREADRLIKVGWSSRD